MHFGLLDLGLLGVMLNANGLVVSIGMHLGKSVSIINLTHDSPQDGTRMCS
jgi:hypothetical protein